jgi:D-alanyl-lipoteichoic acid acyltransferase DltB (MBOAT superfamily)
MLFNSLTFILLFLPVALAGYYGLALLGGRWSALWLVGVSFLFYCWWAAWLVLLLGGSIAFNFTCGALILRAKEKPSLQRALLFLGVGGDLACLIYYKYFFALLNWLGFHGWMHLAQPYDVVLPIGISFFTFTQIGYLVDCKGGIVKSSRPLDYCLFVTFFPHLIAGPILHHREMMPQFANPETFRFRWESVGPGVALFCIGLVKKVVVADSFIETVTDAFGARHGLAFMPAWDGILSYSLQLYFDFSGYSDMACGLALLFGMRFPANFNSPYRAASIIDYWQRFHMTLTRYITLYIYNPVALWVSRQRAARKLSIARAAIATPDGFISMIVLPTFLTMALAGVWHGAGLQFLIFGLLHGAYLTINHAWRSFGPRGPDGTLHPVKAGLAHVGKIALTYCGVLVAQVFFRASSVYGAVRLLKGMVGFYGLSAPPTINDVTPGVGISSDLAFFLAVTHGIALVAGFAVVWTMPNSLQLLSRYRPTLSDIRPGSPISFECRPTIAWGIALGLAGALALLEVTGMTEFLYFRF